MMRRLVFVAILMWGQQARAESMGNGAPGNGAPGNGAPGNGLDANGSAPNGTDSNGMPNNGAPGNGAPGNGADGGGGYPDMKPDLMKTGPTAFFYSLLLTNERTLEALKTTRWTASDIQSNKLLSDALCNPYDRLLFAYLYGIVMGPDDSTTITVTCGGVRSSDPPTKYATDAAGTTFYGFRQLRLAGLLAAGREGTVTAPVYPKRQGGTGVLSEATWNRVSAIFAALLNDYPAENLLSVRGSHNPSTSKMGENIPSWPFVRYHNTVPDSIAKPLTATRVESTNQGFQTIRSRTFAIRGSSRTVTIKQCGVNLPQTWLRLCKSIETCDFGTSQHVSTFTGLGAGLTCPAGQIGTHRSFTLQPGNYNVTWGAANPATLSNVDDDANNCSGALCTSNAPIVVAAVGTSGGTLSFNELDIFGIRSSASVATSGPTLPVALTSTTANGPNDGPREAAFYAIDGGYFNFLNLNNAQRQCQPVVISNDDFYAGGEGYNIRYREEGDPLGRACNPWAPPPIDYAHGIVSKNNEQFKNVFTCNSAYWKNSQDLFLARSCTSVGSCPMVYTGLCNRADNSGDVCSITGWTNGMRDVQSNRPLFTFNNCRAGIAANSPVISDGVGGAAVITSFLTDRDSRWAFPLPGIPKPLPSCGTSDCAVEKLATYVGP